MNNYRHGDMALIGVTDLPQGLTKSDSKILMTGSGGHHHTFDHGEFYPHKDDLVIGYFVARNRTCIYHLEHGKKITGKDLREVKIAAGIYELRRQREDTYNGMRSVVD